MPGISERRVTLVTGKGGVGKTTVATAAALALARQGRRVLLCETSGATRVPALFGKPSRGYDPTQVAPGLWTLSITPAEAIQEYVLLQLHFQRLYRMVFQNRVMGPFVDAVPGLHDLVQLGKVWFAERETENGRPRWDSIVVDAPATGHGVSMLGAPRAMMELTRAGPFYENAARIEELVADPRRTALVLVSTAEEMPVRETEDLVERLGPMRTLIQGVVLNEVHPAPLPAEVDWPTTRGQLAGAGGPEGLAAVRIVELERRAVARQDEARARLGRLGYPMHELPFLFRRDLGRAELESFAATLGVLA